MIELMDTSIKDWFVHQIGVASCWQIYLMTRLWLTLIPYIDLKALDCYVLSQFFTGIEVRKKLFCYHFFCL